MRTREASNNQFGIGYAYPGLCSLCHIEIANFNGSANGRPIILGLKGNYREVMVVLDDLSKMRVTLCDECFDNFSPTDAQELMESEINGWHAEVSDRPDWTEEKKDEYIETYSKKFITTRHDIPWTIGDIAKVQKPRESKLNKKKKGG